MKKPFLVLLTVIMLSLTACSPYRWSEVKDTNGIDRTLQTITAQDILDLNSFLAFISIKSKNSDGTTSVTIDKFSGVQTLETFKKGGRYDITVALRSNSGNIRLVLCDSEKIIWEFEADGEGSTVGFDCMSGNVYLKLAGEEAQVDLQYYYSKK